MTPPTFYVDETYGPRLVGLLREMNLQAVTYRDVPGIESGDRDVDWIPNVAARLWIAVTGDKKDRELPSQRGILRRPDRGIPIYQIAGAYRSIRDSGAIW